MKYVNQYKDYYEFRLKQSVLSPIFNNVKRTLCSKWIWLLSLCVGICNSLILFPWCVLLCEWWKEWMSDCTWMWKNFLLKFWWSFCMCDSKDRVKVKVRSWYVTKFSIHFLLDYLFDFGCNLAYGSFCFIHYPFNIYFLLFNYSSSWDKMARFLTVFTWCCSVFLSEWVSGFEWVPVPVSESCCMGVVIIRLLVCLPVCVA